MNDNLKKFIIERSESNIINEAVKEWKFLTSEITEEEETCPCGHNPIKELCYIQNVFTNNLCFVGNVCINNFLKDYLQNYSNSYNYFLTKYHQVINGDLFYEDYTKLPKPDGKLLQDAIRNKIIYQNEEIFINSIRTKRKLSYKQEKWLISINERIYEFIKKTNEKLHKYISN
jgi:hypothetical protein